MSGIEVLVHDSLAAMNKSTRDWELRAARGECGWICADCLQTAPEGMPDKCLMDQDRCTELIQRDKREAGVPIKES